MLKAYVTSKGSSYVYADGIHGNGPRKDSGKTSPVTITARSALRVHHIGGKSLNENESETAKSDQIPAGKQPQPRVPRSIRFSDSEWACMEQIVSH